MKSFTVFISLVLQFNLSVSAQINKKHTPIRQIIFSDLRDELNNPFTRYGQHISQLLIEGIKTQSITPLLFEQDFTKYKTINLNEFQNRLLFKLPPSTPDTITTNDWGNSSTEQRPHYIQEYIFDRDICIWGIDQTSIFDKKIIKTKFHFIHLYTLEKQKKVYRFSIQIGELLSFLDHKETLLYTVNNKNDWWKGNIFLLNQEYTVDTRFQDFFFKLQKEKKINAYKNIDSNIKINITSEKYIANKNIYFAPYLKEEIDSLGYYKLSTIVFQEYSEFTQWTYGDKFHFKWSEVLTALKNETSTFQSKVCTLKDAIISNQLQPSLTFTPRVISKKGKFISTNTKDSIITKSGLDVINFHDLNSDFSVTQKYGVDFSLKENNYLNKEDGLVSICKQLLLNKKLTPYNNDSLTSIRSLPEINSLFRKVKKYYGSYDNSKEYNKGDTINRGYHEIYIAKQNIKPKNNDWGYSQSYSFRESIDTTVWMKFSPPYYKTEDLDVIQLDYKVTFDQNGENKRYKLRSIGLFIPANENYKGIEVPICWIKWDELKPLLDQHDTTINFIDILENRKLYLFFFWTSNLKNE